MSLIDGQTLTSAPSPDHRDGRFVRGNQAYKTRQNRIAACIERLRASYDVSDPADWAIASIAALNLCDAELARSRVARTRATNAAVRLLKQLTRKPPKPQSIDELLKGRV
jgi:hypothetical protein